MHVFRSIAFASALSGLVAGSAVTGLQYLETAPLIFEAETYEAAAKGARNVHDHSAGNAVGPHRHDEEVGSWQLQDGFERMVFTFLANVLSAIGYAFVLTGLMSLRAAGVDWARGLIWGIAGFVSVMLAPMLALPPELPGTPAAPLAERQIWWIGIAFATAVGIALSAYIRKPWAVGIGLAVMVAPHFAQAPVTPPGESSLVPPDLESRFVIAATVTSFFFWTILGTACGAILGRVAPR